MVTLILSVSSSSKKIIKRIYMNLNSVHMHYHDGQKGATPLISKSSSLWENDASSHLIYYFSEQFPNEFMVSIASFRSSSIQHDVHFVK